MRTDPIRRALIATLTGAAALLAVAQAQAAPKRADGGSGTGTAPLALAAAARSVRALTPAEIRGAYGLPKTGARRQTVAVVSAYDNAQLQADLNAYDKRFKLRACNARNHCLRKLNESGKPSPLPAADNSQFATESAVGVEIVHGVCESCRILLVEATTPSKNDLSPAYNAAAAAGATVIVTAVTPAEDGSDTYYASKISLGKAVLVAAAGDPVNGSKWGYGGGLDFPSSLPNAIAVGGTRLKVSSTGAYLGETAWAGTVSGCSFEWQAPAWQRKDAAKAGCQSRRAVADVAAVAAPGAIVRIAGIDTPGGPWYTATGTSVSAPVIAAVIGLAGSAGPQEARMLYARAGSDPKALHDIRSGENAPGCRSAICKAVRGYDGPTGLGTPRGLGAFRPHGSR